MFLDRGTYRGTIGELRGTIGELYFTLCASSPRIKLLILKDKFMVRGTRNLGDAEITLLKLSKVYDQSLLLLFNKKKNSLFVVISLLISLVNLYITINRLNTSCGRSKSDRSFHALGTDEKSGNWKPQYIVISSPDNIVNNTLAIFINNLCLIRMSDTYHYVKLLKKFVNTPPQKHLVGQRRFFPITGYKLDHFSKVLLGFSREAFIFLFVRYRKVGGLGGVPGYMYHWRRPDLSCSHAISIIIEAQGPPASLIYLSNGVCNA